MGRQDEARKVLESLLNSLEQNEARDEFLVIRASGDSLATHRMMNTSLRGTANLLRLLVRFSPDNNHVNGIVQYLLKERSGGAWQNTHETAYAVLALTDYLLVEQQKQRATVLIIELNGQIYRRIWAENPNGIEVWRSIKRAAIRSQHHPAGQPEYRKTILHSE